MEGSLVYSNTSIVTADGIVNIGLHTSEVYIWNKSSSVNAEIKLNNHYSVLIPGGSQWYTEIDGDYTTVEVVTANSEISIYAIG